MINLVSEIFSCHQPEIILEKYQATSFVLNLVGETDIHFTDWHKLLFSDALQLDSSKVLP